MTDYTNLLSAIHTLHETHQQCNMISPADPEFPLPAMYAGQRDALEKLRQNKSSVLASHTGSGKTATFLSMTHGKRTIVIEPRKFLQKQVQLYRDDVIIFGRSEYPCHYADNAATAPCNRKIRCNNTNYADTCEYKHPAQCNKHPCSLFLYNREFRRYPCSDCKYIDAMMLAKTVLSHGGTVICNFGNFWSLMKDAELVIIDEADLFFREISNARLLHHVKDPELKIVETIDNELKELRKQMQTCTTQQYYSLQNAIYNLDFLRANHELCFIYRKKNKFYIEINPIHTNTLKDRIFAGKDVIIVTATPGDFNLPVISYSIWQRCGIFFTPIGKLTSRSLKMQPWLINEAATFIKTMSSIFGGIYNSSRFVVHCGNIANHATTLYNILGKDDCILHEAGNLMGTIEEFTKSDKKYLLVASAEYGADFTWCNCQFVLKVPYAGLDDRMRALERNIGKEVFNKWYTKDAVTRLIQQCGRVGRGWDSFGCTFILDSKFSEVYQNYNDYFPPWFKERLNPNSF